MADKGLKKSLYTSARLKKGEVIYLETHYNRYELLPLTIWPSPEVIFLTSVEHSSFISPPPVTASFHRYELCFSGEKARLVGSSSNAADAETEKHQNSSHHHSQNGDRASSEHELRDLFRWSRCKKAMPESSMRSIGIPLPADQLEVTSCFLTLKWWIIRIQKPQFSHGFLVTSTQRRCCRIIWNGRMCSGRRLVFGLLERNILSPECISYHQTSPCKSFKLS